MFVAAVWISFGMLLFGWFTDRLCVVAVVLRDDACGFCGFEGCL